MKFSLKIVAATAICFVAGIGSAGAQSLGSLLNSAKDMVEDLTASNSFEIKDIAGTYSYNAPAISIKGDNVLKNIGGSAAASQLESKLAPFYSHIGFDKLQMTISPDSTFTMKLKSITLDGTIAKSDDGLTFTFNKLPNKPVSCTATKSGNKLSLCFDASRLIGVLETVSKYVNLSSVKSMVSLLESYDGLYIGFELNRTGDAASETSASESQATETQTENSAASALGSALGGLLKR